MKQLIMPAAIIVALIAFFIVIDRKEFSRHNDDVQAVQSESPATNRKTTVSVPETKPVTDVKTAAETKPVETKPVAETNPATEAKPVTEAKPKTDTKPAETKPVADTKTVGTNPEEKLLPAAVPVVTAAEAEKLNAEAIEYTKPWINLSSYVEKGYNNIYSANFNKLVGFNLTTSVEKSLQEKGFDVPDFKRRLLPDSWTIDFSTIPAGASFQKVNDGYNLSSIIGSLRILAPRFDSMKGSFFFNCP